MMAPDQYQGLAQDLRPHPDQDLGQDRCQRLCLDQDLGQDQDLMHNPDQGQDLDQDQGLVPQLQKQWQESARTRMQTVSNLNKSVTGMITVVVNNHEVKVEGQACLSYWALM
jgi:hypothetical protein